LAYYEPALTDEAVQYITAIVDDPDPEVRVRAAIALGQTHSKKAKGLLQDLQNDSDTNVRQQASEALQAHRQRTRTETDARSEGSTV